ncbi:CheR family methyltransferase [Limnoglobus roseus]|uniref:Probable chemoreceptor glutamine deamidase CheD n=1 Tax=Limnoglobus roseus TaxID=2598579 RepID=A0A5C1APR0_9BACT|nr:CheR family methyltransferase [Limnoglobus roseus]QEL20585.1 protein-glutamate O-methyltransferase CheR [Limnoglobus roseus]
MPDDSNPQPADDRGGFRIRDREFEILRTYLFGETGIALGDAKRDMICSRLARRMRFHGFTSFADYHDLLTTGDPDGAERQEFINCLTTNKTDFFREPHHFDYLRDHVVPALRAKKSRRLHVWSAGCSTGEEPYTLAMTLRECLPAAEGWDVKITATDIDTAVLATAVRGVYDADRLRDVPPNLLHKHFLKGMGANAGKVAARPQLKDLITFRQVNLIGDTWPFAGPFDCIFCRNVVIYFTRETQQELLGRFARLLAPDGHLFLGHSENIHWMADTFAPLGGTVYRLRNPNDTPPPARRMQAAVRAHAAVKAPAAKDAARQEHTIVLGDVKSVRGPAVLKTLLGSCVSACLYDPTTGVGGMNHFSLPGGTDDGLNTRYGAHAMEMLITSIMKKGGDRDRLRAKVFGGAKVLQVHSEALNVGAKNVAFVTDFLNTEGIPIDGQCLGGTKGLLVRFHPSTGRALAKPLPTRDESVVVCDEEEFGRRLRTRAEAPPADDGVTLF